MVLVFLVTVHKIISIWLLLCKWKQCRCWLCYW